MWSCPHSYSCRKAAGSPALLLAWRLICCIRIDVDDTAMKLRFSQLQCHVGAANKHKSLLFLQTRHLLTTPSQSMRALYNHTIQTFKQPGLLQKQAAQIQTVLKAVRALLGLPFPASTNSFRMNPISL